MSDLISRCELFNRLATIPAPAEANEFKAKIYEVIQSMETADVAYICDREKCERCDPRCDLTRDIEHAATTEKAVFLDGISRPQGKWKEKTTFHNADDNPIIEEWQSAKCSVCGKYHTTPYMYYFNDYNFCPHCGAKMKGAGDEG